MSPENRQSPPLEHVHATKRRRTLKFEQLDENDNRTKSQTATITETLTWKPDQCRNPPTSNRFEPIRSSRNRYKRRKRKHKSVTDDHRQWTFSSRDLSKFKGTIFGRLISQKWNRYYHLIRELILNFFFNTLLAGKFVVVSYNILGVENALKHPDLYDKVPPKFLKWERRKKLIREEMSSYNASILCLQASLIIAFMLTWCNRPMQLYFR